MPFQVVHGATLMCSFGAAPSNLVVLPINMVLSGNQPAANIMDHKPMMNIQPFGMCASLANPQVATATSLASGVLTPQPCMPMTQSPWVPGAPNVLLANQPALDNTSTCMCMWAGVITIMAPGQVTETIP